MGGIGGHEYAIGLVPTGFITVHYFRPSTI